MYRILITGGGGFLGKSLVNFLLRETNYEIISMIRSPPGDPFGSHNRVKIIYHDLREPIGKSCSEKIGKIDYIVHFAAATDVKKSVADPMSFVLDNVVGTTNLLEFALTNLGHLKQFLYFSTAEVFGRNPRGVVSKEDDTPTSYSPYAATKIGAQELCASYERTFKLPVVIAYAMNVFGPHQSQEKFIPLIIEKIQKEETVLIQLNAAGTTPNRRNYLHVDDLCDAILFLSRNGSSGEKYNIAAAEESNNLKIAQLISKLLDKKLNYQLVEQKENSLALPQLSGEKLQSLGWHQKKTLEGGLRELIEWTQGEAI